jgi:hypothetical protein
MLQLLGLVARCTIKLASAFKTCVESMGTERRFRQFFVPVAATAAAFICDADAVRVHTTDTTSAHREPANNPNHFKVVFQLHNKCMACSSCFVIDGIEDSMVLMFDRGTDLRQVVER